MPNIYNSSAVILAGNDESVDYLQLRITQTEPYEYIFPLQDDCTHHARC